MKPRRLYRRSPVPFVVAPTGTHCPKSGSWQSPTDPQICATVHEGQIMPAAEGQSINWQFAGDPVVVATLAW